MYRRRNTWVEVDLEIYRRNLVAMKAALPPPAQLMLVVKANAYGHGITAVAGKAFEMGVRWFLVATLDEAITIRSVLPDPGILLLGGVWPGDIDAILHHRILPVLVSPEHARELAEVARRKGLTLPCHVKVDTGMGRLGFHWETAAAQMAGLSREAGLAIKGVCTHFASTEGAKDPFARVQSDRFRAVLAECKARALVPLFRHAANSWAYSSLPDMDMDAVRLGILAYGYRTHNDDRRVETRPFLQWKTRVIQVKQVPVGFRAGYSSTYVSTSPTCLATLDAGYSDGISRLLSNKGYVLVGGRRAKIVGRVSMSFTIVDMGPDSTVRPGDEAVLIGTQGGASLWADEVAGWCGTIPYEILTSIRSEAH